MQLGFGLVFFGLGLLKDSVPDVKMPNDITSYLIQCSTHEIGKSNATRIASMLRVVSEFEEATDRIYRLVKIVQRKYEKGRHFDALHNEELVRICAQVRLLLEASTKSLTGVTPALMEEANNIEDRIDSLRKNHNRGSIKRMQEGGNVPIEMIYTDINNHLEAVGNHALNVVQNGEPLTGR